MTKAVRLTLSASASALALSLAAAPMPAQASYPGEPQCVFDPAALTATCNGLYWADTLTGNELAVDDLTLVVGDSADVDIFTVYEPGILANWGGDITLDIGSFGYVESEYADAVRVTAGGDFDATVVSDGWVVSRDYDSATGIYVRGQDDVSVQNHGLVAGVTYDGGEYSWGGTAAGIEVFVDGGETGGSVSILNDGVVYALDVNNSYYGSNYGGDAVGILVGTTEAGITINNGNAAGTGAIYAFGDNAEGISANVRGNGAIAITNSGMIDVSAKYDATGISAYASESGVTVDNLASGDIMVDADDYAQGIQAVSTQSTADVDNAGLVDVYGRNATGIVAGSLYGNAIVTNSGDVFVDGAENAAGIGGVSAFGNVSITNTSAGDVEVSGGGQGRPVMGIVGYTISGYYGGGDITIVNAGDVLVSADFAGQGIVADASAKYSGGDSGDITITNSGRVDVSAYGYADGIVASTRNGAVNITNTSTGVIDVAGQFERSVGIQVENDGGEGFTTFAAVAPDISIRNDGRITVSGQNYVGGIYVDAAVGDVSVTNTRTIEVSGVEAYIAGIYAAAHSGDISISNTTTGTITANSDAVYWDGGEYGPGYWIGGGADGVLAHAAGALTIDNAGLIDVYGERSGIGIEASSNGGAITITNQALGRILVDSDMENAVGIEADNGGRRLEMALTAGVQQGTAVYENVTVTNLGTIAVESQDGSARGIDAFSVFGNVDVTNNNTMTVYAGDRATGIDARTVYGGIDVSNGGALVVMATDSDADGIVAESYYGGAVSVSNSGAVSVTSDNGDVDAISVTSSGDVSVNNSGDIRVRSGLGSNYWTEGFGIDAEAYRFGSVDVQNSGAIDVASGFLAVGIDGSSEMGSIEIVNGGTGTIDISEGIFGTGIAAFSWDGRIDVYNYGDITVSGILEDGVGIDVTNRPWFDVNVNGVQQQPSGGMNEMFVFNGGTIDVTASGIAFGVRARGGSYYGPSGNIVVVNDGDISATSGDVSAFGIDARTDGGEGGGGSILIENYGSITTDAEQYSVGIRADANFDSYYGNGGRVAVFNDGDITVTADGGEGGGTATGIWTRANGFMDGGEGGALPQVANFGSIVVYGAGDATGIDAYSKYGSATPLVVNEGTIDVGSGGSAFGIEASVKYGDVGIDNSGDIVVEGEQWYALGILAEADYYGDATVINSGSITATLRDGASYDGNVFGWAVGVVASSDDGDVHVTSDGSITATVVDGGEAIGIFANASHGYYSGYGSGSAYVVIGDGGSVRATATSAVDDTRATGIDASGYYGEVTIGDAATVIAAATATGMEATAEADAVKVYAEYADVSVGAGSTVRATASATRGDAGASAINVETYDGMVTVDTRSIVEATATADLEAYAVGVQVASYGDVFVGNAGTIRATATGDVAYAAALYLSSEYGDITIHNDGTLQASATGGEGVMAAVYLNGNTTTYLDNAGVITGTGGGAIEGFSFASVGDSADTVVNSGTMTGSIDTGNNDDVLWNTSTGVINLTDQHIDLGDWGAVAPPPPMGKLQSAPTPAITGNQFVNDGLIVVNGDGVIDMGTGNPNPFVHAGDIDLQDGSPDDTLTVFGDVSGNGRLFIDINGAAATTDTVYVEGNVRSGTQFTVNGVLSSLPTTATTPINVMVVSGNSGSANLKLGSISMAPGTFVDVGFAVTEQLNAANTADDLHRLTLNITGLSDRGMALAALAPAMQNYWHDSLGTFTRRMGVAEGQELGVPTLWLRAFRSEGEVDAGASGRNFGDANAVAFDQTDSGIELGLDVRLGSQVRIGLMASQGDISTDLAGNAGGMEADVDSVGGYVTWLSPSGFYLDATYRQMEFEARVSAEGYLDRPDAEADGYSLEVGYAWKLDNELVLKPELQYSQMTVDKLDSITNSYGEFSLLDGDSTRLRAGLSINKTFGTKQNSWTPYAGLFYVDEMDGKGTFDVNGDFQGDSDLGGSSIVVEGGVTGQVGKWVLSGGLYWQDGDALKSIIGGQISVRYAF